MRCHECPVPTGLVCHGENGLNATFCEWAAAGQLIGLIVDRAGLPPPCFDPGPPLRREDKFHGSIDELAAHNREIAERR